MKNATLYRHRNAKSLCLVPAFVTFFPPRRLGCYLSTFLLFLSGCASISSPPVSSTPLPKAMTGAYTISGKMIVIQSSGRSSARFRWSEQDGTFEMALWGPLGVGRTMIAGAADYAQIKQGNELLDQGQPGAIMQRQLGWSAPVDVLPFWLRGQVAPTSAAAMIKQDDQGRLLNFSQAGWSVSYANHVQNAGLWRPRKIDIKGRDLQLRLIISQKQPK